MPSVRFRVASLLLVAAWLLTPPPASAQYGYHFGRNKIQYEDFDWHVLKTEHFDVYYYPEMQALAEHGAYFAEEVYRELQNRFNFALTQRVPIIFYASNLHFKQTNTTPGFIPDGVGGFFEFLKGRVVIPANGDLHRFRRVVRHELVHVFTFNKVIRVMRDHRKPPDRFLPLWFTEGLAEYWSGDPDHQHEMVMRDAIFSNYLVPLDNIFRIRGTYQMYKQGEALCRFISETYGEEKLLELIEQFWRDQDFRRVMELTLREEYEVISDRWTDWLQARYYPALEDAQTPSLLADGIAARGFSAKPAYYRFPDGTRKVYFVGNKMSYSNVFEVEVDSLYRPVSEPEILVPGERSERFEAFHLLESRISVSRDGRLAFVTKSGGRDVVHVYDLLRDEMEATYGWDDLIAVYSPDWSPDGTRLTFASIDEGGFSDLYVYDLEADVLHKLTNDLYEDREPAWSPDGRRIAFSSDRAPTGFQGAYNLFTYDVETGRIDAVTSGVRNDQSPRWSPDGTQLVFTSTRPDSTGRFSAQDLYVVDATAPSVEPAVASTAAAVEAPLVTTMRTLSRLTSFTSAAFDPVWTEDDRLVFTSYEHGSFAIRAMDDVDSLAAAPQGVETVDLAVAGEPWAFDRIGTDDGAERVPYKRRYKLDIAQGQVSQSPVLGTTGGAVVAFSDMLGDDHLYLTLYNVSQGERNLLKNLSFGAARYQLHRRANIGYGLYRFAGQRYDRTDPDAPSGYPLFFETIYGGFGSVSYPLSKFRRVEVGTSLNWSDKEVVSRGIDRQALLLSNSISLVHDNALYYLNGPIQGWRANLTTAYTTDLRYSNVSYMTFMADLRHYWRIGRHVTLASWGMARLNEGREARLFLLGGSWDLRGYRLFAVRGEKMWFTSHELRFPILVAPYLYAPVLAPFGVAALNGALFFDAAHAWNDGYSVREPDLLTGETLGAAGFGFRLNLFGAFVLRYDLGWRYRDGFREQDKFFKQFFFGWNF